MVFLDISYAFIREIAEFDMTEIIRIVRIREPISPRFIDEAKKIYSDLQAEITHAPPCICPACLFNQYRKYPRGAGHPFSKEAFFLDWLSFEIRLSMLEKTTAYVGEKLEEKSYIRGNDLFCVRGYIKETIKFINYNKKRFPKITNTNPGRIKLSLWRFKKSRILNTLAQERALQDPSLATRAKAAAIHRRSMQFVQRVADFIKTRPGKRETYREIYRHFSKKKSDIDKVLPWLREYYNMRIEKHGASLILVHSPPSVEQVKAFNQKIAETIIDEENALFGEDLVD
jgi:hypothetical protein